MYVPQLDALQAGATVVTANKRLARTLRAAYNAQQIGLGHTAWPAPDVLSWNAWLRRLWDGGRLAGDDQGLTLLSDAAAACLWQQIVQADAEADSGAAAALSRAARKAWGVVNEWQALAADEWTQPDLSPDQKAWLRWSGVYRDRCRDAGWTDSERLTGLLAAQAAAGAFAELAPLMFCGMDEWTPARQKLLDALAAAGSQITINEPSAAAAQPAPAPSGTIRDEWRCAASWARAQIEATPGAAIGVVVPDLMTTAGEVRREFLDVLAPDWRVNGVPSGLPLNVSYGQQLADLPAIAAALRLLSLADGPASFDQFSLVLRSPWLAGAQAEAGARAQLDIRLRDELRVEFSLRSVLSFCGGELPELRRVLAELDRFAGRQRRSAADWAHACSDLLQSLGWPGTDSLDSYTWQTVKAWNEQLGEFADAASVFGPLTHTQALGILAGMTSQTLFQPQGSVGGGIQVMGVLEAAGHEFDELWVTGMARELWPGTARPDPFIPLELQRRLTMPDSSPARSLEFAGAQLSRLAQSATSLVISWPEQQDGELLGSTPLFGEFSTTMDDVAPAQRWNSQMQAAGGTAKLAHDPPPPWPAGQKVSGGARVLTQQATSPLNAFIERRLGAFEIRRPGTGISAMQRGNLTHRALEDFYTATPAQADAAALADSVREARLRDSLEAGLADLPGIDEPFMRRLAAAELEQQLERIEAFLAIDREREPFTVSQREQDHDVEIGSLALRLKLDRLDTLSDGSQLVIDYKTGHISRQNWNPDNPRDLQLPLYVSLIAPSAGAVAFAQISSRGIGYDGVGGDDIPVDGLRSPGRRNVVEVKYQYPYTTDVIESWDELRRVWNELLARLAAEFAAGDFRFDPRNPDSARGQFAVLSRVYDDGMLLAEDDE